MLWWNLNLLGILFYCKHAILDILFKLMLPVYCMSLKRISFMMLEEPNSMQDYINYKLEIKSPNIFSKGWDLLPRTFNFNLSKLMARDLFPFMILILLLWITIRNVLLPNHLLWLDNIKLWLNIMLFFHRSFLVITEFFVIILWILITSLKFFIKWIMKNLLA